MRSNRGYLCYSPIVPRVYTVRSALGTETSVLTASPRPFCFPGNNTGVYVFIHGLSGTDLTSRSGKKGKDGPLAL